MIVLRYAHLANRAMFRPCRFCQLASLAIILLLVKNSIVVLLVLLHHLLHVLLGDLSWPNRAGLVVHPKAKTSQRVGEDDIVVRDSFIGHMLEDSRDFVEDEAVLIACYPPTAIKR